MAFAAISFLGLYLLQIVLMAFVMRAINGRFIYGVLLGLGAACWFPSLMGVAAGWVSRPPEWAGTVIALMIILPGVYFVVEWNKVRPKEETIANMVRARGFKIYRNSTSIVLFCIGIPFVGIIVCVWFLLFKKDEFLQARQ